MSTQKEWTDAERLEAIIELTKPIQALCSPAKAVEYAEAIQMVARMKPHFLNNNYGRIARLIAEANAL